MRVAAIQRRCGERTAGAYLEALRDFDEVGVTGGDDLFDAALHSLRIASEIAADWTLLVDADMRLYSGARASIEAAARTSPPDVYQVRFLCDDKISGQPIFGVHLHRNRLAAAAHAWFLSQGVRCLKSESRNIRRFMQCYDLRTLTTDVVVASHDFGQYFRDIYRKYIVRGLRRPLRLQSTLDALANRLGDPDVTAAVAGLERSRGLAPTPESIRHAIAPDEPYATTGLAERQPMQRDREDDDMGWLRHSRFEEDL